MKISDILQNNREPLSRMEAQSMIAHALDKSDLTYHEMHDAARVLDNAAAYRLDAPTDNRHARMPTVYSIAQEWADRGVTRETARDLLDRTIGFVQSRREEREQERER